MLALASVLIFAQTPALAAPPVRPGCATLVTTLDATLHLDEGGYARAKDACYEELASGIPLASIRLAMEDYGVAVASSPGADPGGPPPGDGWTALLAAPPANAAAPASNYESRAGSRIASRVSQLEIAYWGSCDDGGPHGACDQMGSARFRVGPTTWAAMRYFDYYSHATTAGAAGLGIDEEFENFSFSAGLWAGTWAEDCVRDACRRGAAFVLPYADVRIGPPAIFIDAGVADGPYIASGHARFEIGHAFENGSRLEAGMTAGVFGLGPAARADARIVVFRHISLDLYGSAGSRTFAFGGGAGVRY